ncbi:copper resistance protein [Escherichia coli]|nr:copper resistance protein [Escherichia coli]OKT24452.1 copper resistance protein [Escherichia coli]
MSIKNDGHYFCRAGGNRPDGLNEPVTNTQPLFTFLLHKLKIRAVRAVHGAA